MKKAQLRLLSISSEIIYNQENKTEEFVEKKKIEQRINRTKKFIPAEEKIKVIGNKLVSA